MLLDLTNETFTAGRTNTSDYCFSAPEVPAKMLLQLSKEHFKITKDLSDLSNPAYIEVNVVTVFFLHMKYFFIKFK